MPEDVKGYLVHYLDEHGAEVKEPHDCSLTGSQFLRIGEFFPGWKLNRVEDFHLFLERE